MSNTPSDTKTENLGFTIENRAGADVVVWKEGGCRPATSAEIAMWKALSAVQQPVVREPLTCEWTHNDDDGYWDTSCGKAWGFDDGGPKENNMNFCHCCGKTLSIKGKEAAMLTDEQLAEMMRDTWGCASIAPRHALEFARAVERAHGIKGGQHGTE